MAKRKISTDELIKVKESEIVSQKELLDKLNLELKELQDIKTQEEKDELYNMMQTNKLSLEDMQKLFTRINTNNINKGAQIGQQQAS